VRGDLFNQSPLHCCCPEHHQQGRVHPSLAGREAGAPTGASALRIHGSELSVSPPGKTAGWWALNIRHAPPENGSKKTVDSPKTRPYLLLRPTGPPAEPPHIHPGGQ